MPGRSTGHVRPLVARCLVVVLLGVGAAFPSSGDAAAAPTTFTIVIEAVRFEPAMVAVKRGDVVIWINKDPVPHSVVAQGHFDSHSIAPGGTWKYVARTAGQYGYFCSFHPTMKGELRVE